MAKSASPNTEDLLSDRNIRSLLEQLGFSKGEVNCYLAALTLGPTPISEIAKVARVNRVSAYGAVKKLIEHGLVEQEITSKGTRIHPAPLEQLQDFAYGYQKRATKLRWRVEDLIPQLRALAKSKVESPRFLVFEGKRGVYAMFERSLRVPAGSEIFQMCLFLEDDIASPKYSREHYLPARLKRNIRFRLLCPNNAVYRKVAARDQDEFRETRFLPHLYAGQGDLLSMHIYGDEVALYWRTPDPKGIVIQSGQIASVMRMLFNIAWEIAKKPQKRK